MKKPNNLNEIRRTLCEIIEGIRAQTITPDAAEAVSNASGKVIASLRVELEYRRARAERPEMPFIDGK